jgi:putative ABC transport system permease protein
MIRGDVRRLFQLALRRRDRWERDVEEEIKLHLTLRAEQLVARGQSVDDAYAEAIRRFGPLDESRARLLEAAHHRETRMHRTEYLSDLKQDLRFAARTLRRQRAWTAVTIITLALGIGATTAVFSVVSSLLLHPVPYPDADRVVFVDQQPSAANPTGLSISILPGTPIVRAWLANNHSFETLQGYVDQGDGWLGGNTGDADRVHLVRTVPTFNRVTGVTPIVGRMFTDREASDRAHVVVIGEALWQSRFAGARSAIGKSIVVDDSSYTIIGVLPAAARLPRPGAPPPDVWLPLDINSDRFGVSVGVSLVGRLRPGVTIERARADLDSIYSYARSKTSKLQFTTRIVSPAQLVHFRETLLMLAVAVGVVLLVACANVAHLQLTRAASRSREMAIRATLGAGRRRLLRQLLTESLLLAGAGGVAGMLVGWLGLRAILIARPSSLSELSAAHLDGTTLGLTLVVAVVCGIGFGLVGAVYAGRRSTNEALKAGATNASGSRASARFRAVLVVSEMALSAALLVGATMLVRSVIIRQRADLGFNPAELYSIDVDFPNRYATPAARSAFNAEAEARVRAIPGVRAVSVAQVGPTGRAFNIGALEVQGEPPAPVGQTAFIDDNSVMPNFFSTLGIRLVEGTTFTDTSTAAHQVVVNEGFARKHWPRGTAVGHHIRVAFNGGGVWKTIVGVAADASPSGPAMDMTAPMLYGPPTDNGSTAIYFRAAGGGDVAQLARNVVRAIDPSLHPTITSVEGAIHDNTSAPRFIMKVLSAFTVLALALAAIGLYGVMAHAVAQRTREIGIRVALGASRGRIAKDVVLRGVALAVVGAILGLAASHWGTTLIQSQLYGVPRTDALSLIIGGLALIAAALIACLVPTRRALRVDPMTAIRAE